MRLNAFEMILMNNPARALSQRTIESRWMRRFAGPAVDGCALEIGCGRGVGIETILAMGAREVHGFDIDSHALRLACRRLRRFAGRYHLWLDSADNIHASNERYDAVFDFGVLHHVRDWRIAIAESCRVLRPGGRFIGEEMLRRFVDHPVSQALFNHPRHDRFDLDDLVYTLDRQRMKILCAGHLAGLVGWFAAEKEG
jgi:ubiquinone/menaquinone biosynthesis C-methylase UbiE